MDNNDIKVSVIIPVYNVEKYLEKCLQSVVFQTLKNIEIICVDDCSSDGSSGILAKFSDKDKRLKVINNSSSLGAAAARNKALRIAKGEYIGFVDSDDWIDLNYYEVLYNKAKEKNADIVRTMYYYSTEDIEKESELNRIIEKRHSEDANLGANEHSVVIWNAIYKRSFLIEKDCCFDEVLLRANDVPFTARVTLAGGKMVPAVGTNYHYRQNVKSQLSTFSVERAGDVLKSNGKVMEVLNGSNVGQDDYLEAFQRCIWRYDNIFSRALKLKGFNKEMRISFVEKFFDNFSKCKYMEAYKKKYSKEYTAFCLSRDVDGYIRYKTASESFFRKIIRKIKKSFKKK